MRDDVLPYLEFGPDGWEGFLAARSRNFRSQLGRRERRLAREHEVVHRLTARADDLDDDLAWLRRLHDARWEARGGSGWTDDVWEAHGHFAARGARARLAAPVERRDRRRTGGVVVRLAGRRALLLHALGLRPVATRTMRSASSCSPTRCARPPRRARGSTTSCGATRTTSAASRPASARLTNYAVTRRRHPLRAVYATVAATIAGARRLPPRAQEPLRWAQERRWLGRR